MSISLRRNEEEQTQGHKGNSRKGSAQVAALKVCVWEKERKIKKNNFARQ